MKKGRNTKCHCGSGKKYKHCHENKDSKNSNQYFLIGGVCFVFVIIFFLSTRKDNNSNISDLINSSSVIASIEIDENISTVATLKILNPTWLQLRDENNNIVLSKLMDKDEEFSYELNLNYNITTGNAGNILVLIDGNVRGKIGKYGDILDSFVLFKDFIN